MATGDMDGHMIDHMPAFAEGHGAIRSNISAAEKSRLSGALQKLRAENDQFGNFVAEHTGASSPQKVNRNHGNNPVNNLTQG